MEDENIEYNDKTCIIIETFDENNNNNTENNLFACTYCNFQCKRKYSLKRHLAFKHDIGVEWFPCTSCDYQSKNKYNLEKHLAFVHNIGVELLPCTYCDYQFKMKSDLKRHLAFVHNIGVEWFPCTYCDYQGKKKSDLKKHLEFVHDIGEYKCAFCLSMRNSRNSYTDSQGTHEICRKCYAMRTGKQSRKETLWSKYLDEKLEFPATSSDKSLKSIGGCILQRPDKLYTSQTYTEVGECDEFEHLTKNGDYSCDEERITKIYDEEGIMGTHLVVLRWNPDDFKAPRGVRKPNFEKRMEIYVALSQKLREYSSKNKFNESHIHIYYMFYSKDNPIIAKNIPYTMIYSMNDVEKLVL